MPSIPLPGETFTFSVPIEDQANAGLFKASPTIAAGDFKRSINGGAFANMDNLPAVTPAGGRLVQIVVSAAETTAAGDGGVIDIVGNDASGSEWYDIHIGLRVGPLSANVTYSAGVALGGRLAEASAVNDMQQQIDEGFTDTNQIIVAILEDTGTTLPATLALEATAQAVLEDTSTTLPGLIAVGVGPGSGTGYYTDTIDNGTNPLDGVRVQLYTAPNRVGPAYEAYTNALGVFEMWPDPGVYYRWLDLAGYSFTQDVEVEVTEP